MTKPDDHKKMFSPKKYLGQNFLVDRNVIDRIVDACSLQRDELILEIGPGQGALTQGISSKVDKVVAIEADHVLAQRLLEQFKDQNVSIFHEDFLKFDFSRLPAPIKVVGNIPYNISSPIIRQIIENRKRVSTLFATTQYEFGIRLIASAGSKDYSSLSCFVQMFTRPRMLFKISPQAFRPCPKVMSCFMRFDMRLEPAEHIDDEEAYVRIVRQAFQQRRKNLLNSLAPLCPQGKSQVSGWLASAAVDAQARAEDLTIADYARISNVYTKNLLPRH